MFWKIIKSNFSHSILMNIIWYLFLLMCINQFSNKNYDFWDFFVTKSHFVLCGSKFNNTYQIYHQCRLLFSKSLLPRAVLLLAMDLVPYLNCIYYFYCRRGSHQEHWKRCCSWSATMWYLLLLTSLRTLYMIIKDCYILKIVIFSFFVKRSVTCR